MPAKSTLKLSKRLRSLTMRSKLSILFEDLMIGLLFLSFFIYWIS